MQTLEAQCSAICTRLVVSKRPCQVLKPGQLDPNARPFLVNLSPQSLSFSSRKANTLEKAFSEVKWYDYVVDFLWNSVQERHWGWWIQAPSERYEAFEYNVPSSTISKWMHTLKSMLAFVLSCESSGSPHCHQPQIILQIPVCLPNDVNPHVGNPGRSLHFQNCFKN